MLNSLYIGLSQQMALRNQMDGIANNIANMNTTGFKGEQILFREFLVPAAGTGAGAGTGTGTGTDYSYVMDFGVARDFTEGEIKVTGNPFDVAIKGEGFFVVETTNGDRYTRNGHFAINGEGTLVTSAGDPVLSDSGSRLTFGPEDGAITISPDGSISAELTALGGTRLGLVTFANLQALENIGQGLFTTGQAPEDAEDASLQQGMIETSNVNSVIEMTRMIDVSRKYQLIQRLIDAGYDLERTAIQRLGQVQ